jgi:nitric oxide reductase subunit B
MDDHSFIQEISPWWRRAVILTLVVCFGVQLWIAYLAYQGAPPIPDKVVNGAGETLFTGADITAGQQVFLKYGLMENGTIWGHGAYLGPDFSAEYLHTLGKDAGSLLSRFHFGRDLKGLPPNEQGVVEFWVRELLKENRYDSGTRTLEFKTAEEYSFLNQVDKWTDYFVHPELNGGLKSKYIQDPVELRQLTAFFAWAAWASVTRRPERSYSYTNNFPYDPLVGNTPTAETYIWSALSLITLLAGTAAILFAFGKFSYLGWRGTPQENSALLPGQATAGQRAALKFFIIVPLLFLAQTLIGAAVGHNRAEPGSFFGIDLYQVFPSNILRTWHLQLALFWITTAYVGGGLLLASSLNKEEQRGHVPGINLLFAALVIVVLGSLLGEFLGINNLLGKLWFWFGHQGWEYLDLGRGWQVLLALGLIIWVVLLWRQIKPALKDPDRREISWLFMAAAAAIPLFYLPAFFFGSSTNYTLVDNWRFWIIHLWVEGFMELLVTVMVAVTFFRMGLVSRQTAVRVIYLDAILFLGSGIIGTGHHWYWTGQSSFNLALSALFSAMEVIPLTLLTLDAWDFVKVTRVGDPQTLPHKWTFYFLMAVGFWNFVGAGIFGFLINLPIVSYFEVGTILTPNHAHSALMGAFGMEAMALTVMAFRQVLTDEPWARVEKFIRVSFWGLNLGLALMVIGNLFPGGVMQLIDVLQNGYWHARGQEYLSRGFVRFIEWCRMPGDLIFIFLGVVPMVWAALLTYKETLKAPASLKEHPCRL